MNQTAAQTWWRIPIVWMVVGLPLAAVIAGVATVVIAFNNQDALVTSEVHKLGFTTTQVYSREDRAANLGLSAKLAFTRTGLTLALTGGSGGLPTQLTLKLIHPTEATQDQSLQFVQSGPAGHYQSAPMQFYAGRRQLVLEPGDGSWRLLGVWPAMLESGEITLLPGIPNPTPHP